MKFKNYWRKLFILLFFQFFILLTSFSFCYAQTECGYFPGTFSFENDENGAIPSGWVDSSQANGEVQVVESAGGHTKVVELYSISSSNSRSNLDHDFTDQVAGTIEFWIMKSSEYQSGPAILYLYGAAGLTLMNFIIDEDTIGNYVAYVDPSGAWTPITGYSYSDDRWFHMRIEWDCTSDTWDLWIDEVKYLFNSPFENSRTDSTVTWMRFSSFEGGNEGLYYIDAIGFSWDPNYNIGDNLEGLECENPINPEIWQIILGIIISIIVIFLVGAIVYSKSQSKPVYGRTNSNWGTPRPTYRPEIPKTTRTESIRQTQIIRNKPDVTAKYCPYCGTLAIRSNKFCTNCGLDLNK